MIGEETVTIPESCLISPNRLYRIMFHISSHTAPESHDSYPVHYGVNSGQLAKCRVFGPRTRNRGLNLDPVARFPHRIGAGKRFFGTKTAKSLSSLVGVLINLASDYPVHSPDHFGT